MALILKDNFFHLKKQKMNNEKIRNARSFDELLDAKYGTIGSDNREEFEEKAQYFVISEMLKDNRKTLKGSDNN